MLEVKNLHTHYGHLHILKGLNFSVNEGEIVSLIGSNGAGKTTLLKTISGLIKPGEGSIKFLGREIGGEKPAAIVSLGISQAPEGRRIFPRMSVLDNLLMGNYARKSSGKELKQDLERIYHLFPRLIERQHQQGGTLSGGEQQMLAIGRALMARPKLLLLDEPSMGLAPMMVAVIFEVIKDISKKGTTILLVEQNASIALQIAQHGYVLETGKIILQDKAENLLNNQAVKKAYLGHA